MAPAGILNEHARCGRLDRPPRPHCYIDLPPEFGRRFTVFCDTEEEFDWAKPLARENRSTTHMRAMPAMQDRFRRRGVKPVYLIDHPIASDPASAEMLREWVELGQCSVGTQLHPWVNPPFDEEVSPFNSFTGNLPTSLQRAKLAVLTDAIEQAVGRRPTVYRAGRYGVGEHTAALLTEQGYDADVSVRPLFDYSDQGGPDFSRVRPQPFRVGEDRLVELPLSTAWVGRLRGRGLALYRAAAKLPRGHGLLARSGLLLRVPLTPEGTPLAEAKAAVRALIADGVRWFSLSFHSPSVEPGHTPFVRDAGELESFHAWWEGMFDLFEAEGIAPASVEETVAAAQGAAALHMGPADPIPSAGAEA
ncbi:polysaccharide deacetylase family protein [Allosphingosinicella sp.]|uniref:polysaccharide deacetylase family protein n=1 Tax=Allosphingosinicella sp. TaxID=2823234 RepID=UPI002F073719